ncbi:hypothetical protein CSPAE12_10140 [Colletotrichum incanum]|nr:hypothetical protein CSPAE12_10140 [Colletotrichum incanum]
MALNLTVSSSHIAIRNAWKCISTSLHHPDVIAELTRAMNNTLKTWECLVMGMVVVNLVITLYGISAKIPDTVIPISNEVVLVAFTELVSLLQLMQILLPVYPAEEFAMFTIPQNITNPSLCKWTAGLFGLQEAEFPSHRLKVNENDLNAFGIFLMPVVAAVVWKWRRVRRRQREIRTEEQAALVARAFWF